MNIKIFPKLLGLVVLFLLFQRQLAAQNDERALIFSCGTLPPTEEDIKMTLHDAHKNIVKRSASTTYIPIQAQVVRNDDKTGGISILNLNQGLANINLVYRNAGIQFFWKDFPNYVNSSDYVKFDSQDTTDLDTESGLKSLFNIATDAVNVYYTNSITRKDGLRAAGYAYYPTSSASSNTIVMTYRAQVSGVAGTFAHEFGHYFNLYHTHQGTENGNTNANAENVARSGLNANCSTKGDLLCDTEADPRYNASFFNTANCQHTGTTTDIHNQLYTPPVENIMSYYPDKCTDIFFTDEQYERILRGVSIRRSNTAYNLNAQPQNIANPSGLSLTKNGTRIILAWKDNANDPKNDMGYLIERSSTSATEGFAALPFGATTTDATTFTDVSADTNKTYFYRVRASNDYGEDFSNVVSTAVLSSVDLLDEGKKRVSIAPNPNQGTFTLRFYADRPKLMDIKIYDILGRLVATPQYKAQEGENFAPIELPAALQNGLYFLRLSQNGKEQVAAFKKF